VPGVRSGAEEREAVALGLARGEPLAEIACAWVVRPQRCGGRWLVAAELAATAGGARNVGRVSGLGARRHESRSQTRYPPVWSQTG